MMNVFKSLLLFSSIVVGPVSARSKKSDKSAPDVTGALSINKNCDGLDTVKMECAWEAMASKSRRVRHNRKLREVQVPGGQRVLSVELDDVECFLEIGAYHEYYTELHFPEDFSIEKRTADGEDDFFVFVAKVAFDGTDVEGEIEVGLALEVLEDIELAVYDDSSISIDCP